MPRKCAAILLTIMLSATLVHAGPVTYDFGQKKPVNACIRSVILPGWGQYFNEQETKAYITGGAVVVLGFTAYYFYSESNTSYDDYEKLGLKDSALYDDYEKNADNAMYASLLCAGTWIYAAVDAYISRDKINRSVYDEFTKARGLIIARKNSETGLYYSVKF
ncbi:MAG: hypothetical protein JW803_06530 [Endomicrobiales bacterium]|nr:hypothetical protein [Endomicrobiales bacterium]